MKDQLSRPLSFLSAACLLQLFHLSFCFTHFALAASHCFCVHFETSSVVDFALSVIDWLVAIDTVGAKAVPAATAPADRHEYGSDLRHDVVLPSMFARPASSVARASIMLRGRNCSA